MKYDNSFSRFFAIGVLAASTSAVADFDGSVKAAVGFSDNIARTETGEIDDVILAGGFAFTYAEKTRRLESDISADLDYYEYTENTFENEWLGTLNGIVNLALVEERFDWAFTDTFGQQQSDPFSPATPDTREYVNIFTTGPRIRLLPPGRNQLELNASYTRSDYEKRNSDNDQYMGSIRLGRELSRNTSIALVPSHQRIEFNVSQIPSIEQSDLAIEYTATGSRNDVSVSVGGTEVEAGGFESDGLLLDFSWTYRISDASSVSVTGGSRYSAQGDSFGLYQSLRAGRDTTVDNTVSDAPFRNNYFGVSQDLSSARNTIKAAVSFSQEDFEDGSGLDRDVFSGSLAIRREFRRDWSTGVSGGVDRREFKYFGRRDDDLKLGFDLAWDVTARLTISAEYDFLKRNSTESLSDFEESRAFLRFTFASLDSGRVR